MKNLPENPRILIVRLSAIGDVVHALPSLRLLRQAFPGASLGWVVEDFAAAFVEGHPDLDQLHVIPKQRWRGAFWRNLWPEIRPFVGEIRRQRYDVAIDFQGLTKSGALAWLSGARRRIGFGGAQGRELSKLLTNEKVVPPEQARHIIEQNAALLAPLGIDAKPQPPVLALQQADEERALAILKELGLDGPGRVAGLNLGAGWVTKQWPVEHWMALGGLLSRELGVYPLLLWGSPPERELAEEARRGLEAQGVPAALAPPTSLRENAALLKRLDLYCGGDTGATHVAAAQGVPTIGIHGASDAVRNGPFGPRVAAIQLSGLHCAPCWKKKNCGHDRKIACLTEIKPEDVFEAARELLEEPLRSSS